MATRPTFTEGTTVITAGGKKGVIDHVITKSTGYVEVKFEDGTSKKFLKKHSKLSFEDGTPVFKGKPSATSGMSVAKKNDTATNRKRPHTPIYPTCNA